MNNASNLKKSIYVFLALCFCSLSFSDSEDAKDAESFPNSVSTLINTQIDNLVNYAQQEARAELMLSLAEEGRIELEPHEYREDVAESHDAKNRTRREIQNSLNLVTRVLTDYIDIADRTVSWIEGRESEIEEWKRDKEN